MGYLILLGAGMADGLSLLLLLQMIENDIQKSNAKNRVRVAMFTGKEPHTHWTVSFPMCGIADSGFLVAFAVQNNICPHSRT